MNIFEKAKQIETRKEYVDSRLRSFKYLEEEFSDMQDYILSEACVRDLERLESGDYFLDYPAYRLVPKNFSNRKRAVYYYPGTEGLVIKLLVFSLRGYEKTLYSDRLYSFRSDKNATDLLLETCGNKEIRDLYILKTDVSNYVGSIVPELIIPVLKKLFSKDDPAFCRFLIWLLSKNKVYDVNGDLIDHCPGGLGGVPVGNLFMNVYLHEIDEYFAPRSAYYARYSDDILICAHTFDEIEAYRKQYFAFLERLKLSTNPDKTMILKPGEAFDLMGMCFSNGSISISGHSMQKIKRNLRRFTHTALVKRNSGRLKAEEAAHDLIIQFNRFFFGFKGGGKLLSWARWAFPVISDTGCLKEIDHFFQDSLRYVLYGSMKKRNLSIPYERLRELGYRSLIYYYHHQEKIVEIERDL